MQALILAGGKGTRLSEITKNEIPKPMAQLNGKPILQYAIERLKENGIEDIFISVGYLHEKIEEYFGNGQNFGVKITYICENVPLGSGGALFYLKNLVTEDFVICSGDAIFDIDIKRMYRFHKENNALITLLTHPNLHPYDSDLIISDKNHIVTEINLKNSTREFYYKNSVNAGFFIINPSTLDYFSAPVFTNLEHDFVASFIPTHKVFAYQSSEYIKDVGTPERFMLAQKDIQLGLVSQKNLKNKQKAIFLDRDGTLNVYKGFIKKSSDITLFDDVIDSIKTINQSGYLAIIVSNQPVIARGEASFQDVEEMFNKIETLLGMEGAYIDGIYYCPHHPHKGFDGEIPELKIDCGCRKPKIGLVKQAESDFNLDLSKCYIIGDTNSDIQMGINAGLKTIRVETGKVEEDKIKADYTSANLMNAVKKILEDNNEKKDN